MISCLLITLSQVRVLPAEPIRLRGYATTAWPLFLFRVQVCNFSAPSPSCTSRTKHAAAFFLFGPLLEYLLQLTLEPSDFRSHRLCSARRATRPAWTQEIRAPLFIDVRQSRVSSIVSISYIEAGEIALRKQLLVLN